MSAWSNGYRFKAWPYRRRNAENSQADTLVAYFDAVAVHKVGAVTV